MGKILGKKYKIWIDFYNDDSIVIRSLFGIDNNSSLEWKTKMNEIFNRMHLNYKVG